MKAYSSLFEQEYSGDESADTRRTQQDLYDEIMDSSRSDASVKVRQEDYQLVGTFDMDLLI